jgi:Ca2+-binding RTX toxin-like protein
MPQRGLSDPDFLAEQDLGVAPDEVFGRSGDDFLAGEQGNDRLDGGPGFDSGTGGVNDGRLDWSTSVERSDERAA